MFKFIIRFIITTSIIFIVASTGVQIDENKVNNPILEFFVIGWNSLATSLNRYVIEHDEELIDYGRRLASDGTAKINVVLDSLEKKSKI